LVERLGEEVVGQEGEVAGGEAGDRDVQDVPEGEVGILEDAGIGTFFGAVPIAIEGGGGEGVGLEKGFKGIIIPWRCRDPGLNRRTP